MKHIDQVLLDMDGVITDFVKGICNAHMRKDPYLDPSNNGLFEMDKIWDMEASVFWEPCGYDFWASLDFVPDAKATLTLLDDLIGYKNICLLTAPSQNEGCIEGKRDWVKRNLPEFGNRILFGSAKHFCSGPRRLLIDDRDSNIMKYDGPGFLVPRPWNAANSKQDNWHLSLERLFLEGSL